jgi:Flp pilus assembly pilin Flp
MGKPRTRGRRLLRRLLGDSGASFLEYAMLCALIGIAVSIAVAAFGKHLKELFATLSGKVEDVNTQLQGSGP